MNEAEVLTFLRVGGYYLHALQRRRAGIPISVGHAGWSSGSLRKDTNSDITELSSEFAEDTISLVPLSGSSMRIVRTP